MAIAYLSPAQGIVGNTVNTINLPLTTPTVDSFSLATVWSSSTSATVNTPSGWTKALDTVSFGGMRMAVFHRYWTGTPDASVAWTFSTSLYCIAQSNHWLDVDPDNPFIVAPAAATAAGATTGATETLPAMTPADAAGTGVWFWAHRPLSGASTATLTITTASNLLGAGTTRTNGSQGYGTRAGYASALPAGASTETKAATSSASVAWAGVGMVLRESADVLPSRGDFFPFLGPQHHDDELASRRTRRERLVIPRRRLAVMRAA